MARIRIAAVALNATPLDWNGNRKRIVAALDEARAKEAALVCLPEMCISGYGCEDAFLSESIPKTSLELLAELLPATRGLAATFGLPLVVENALYNACVFAVDGAAQGFVLKQHLPRDGIHYEPRWFQPWPAGKAVEVDVLGALLPAGDLLFDVDLSNGGDLRLGMEICHDAWMPNRPAIELARRGAGVILNPSATHFAFGKQEIRRRIALTAARELGVTFAFSNLLGNEAGRAIYDGGSLIADSGEIVAAAPRFSFADHTLTLADVETTSRPANDANAIACGLAPPLPTVPISPTQMASWDASPPPKHEEFTRAVALGLFDYLRKSKSKGFVVSLSGGADSAAVATLVWAMCQLGVAELGAERFAARIGLAADVNGDTRELVRRLLICVYQSTRNSSDVTRQAAETVARAIGAEFHDWSVDDIADRYVETVAAAIQRDVDWQRDDVALQNIQARARAPGVWLLANLKNALLLATGNRSEASVGYATMDGDTCGGLAPIAGVDKTYLREWLRWMETTGPTGVGALPALAAVNSQRPTAELRPPGEHQTDEGDLMPYDVLDAIVRVAIRDNQMPLAVWRIVAPQFAEHSREQIAAWVERFFTLWSQNQWKRERLAPSLHLDDLNVDPRTWRRFPIHSGGFERELAELRAAVGATSWNA